MELLTDPRAQHCLPQPPGPRLGAGSQQPWGTSVSPSPRICAIKSSGSGAAPTQPKTITEPRAPRSTNRRLGVPQAPRSPLSTAEPWVPLVTVWGARAAPRGWQAMPGPAPCPAACPQGLLEPLACTGRVQEGSRGRLQGPGEAGAGVSRISRAREVMGTGPGTTPGCVCPAHRGLEMAGGATRAAGCARRELLPLRGGAGSPCRVNSPPSAPLAATGWI